MRALTAEELELVAGGVGTSTSGGGGGGSTITITGTRGGGTTSWWPTHTSSAFTQTGGGGGGGGGGTAGTDPTPSTPSVDFNFLTQHEGGIKTSGYVPASGHSGVTIGAGVDLGQQSAATLSAAGVPQSIINELSPYFGLQGSAASDYLSSHPLTISLSDATTLSNDMETYYAQQVGDRYNAASDLNFFDLPTNTQTAIVDLAYQYGLNLASATPNFWSEVTQGDWGAAYNNLENFGDAYTTRRHDEADLLETDIQSGVLG